MKRLLRSAPIQAAIAWIVAQYIRVVFATGRWSVKGIEPPSRLVDAGKPLIGCFWHGRMLMMPKIWRFAPPLHMLISNHRDGRLIARAVEQLGIRTITGSSSRGGAAALRVMNDTLRNGGYVAVTPDGPRGPRMHASPGIVMIAKLSGAPVFPVGWSCSRAITLSSWDRFLLALPFGRGIFIVGEPITVPSDADEAALESYRYLIEERLNQVTFEADLACGRQPVEPAPHAEPAAGRA